MSQPRPGLAGVLETCLYHAAAEAEEIHRFYADVLGLREVSRWPGGVAFRAGAGVVLLFSRESLVARGGPISEHGTSGPGHVCLLAKDGVAYDAWKLALSTAGVKIAHEHDWGGGRRSIFFADPAGNLLEVAHGDLWPS